MSNPEMNIFHLGAQNRTDEVLTQVSREGKEPFPSHKDCNRAMEELDHD